MSRVQGREGSGSVCAGAGAAPRRSLGRAIGSRRFWRALAATLCVMAGALLMSGAPAQAELVHPSEPAITEPGKGKLFSPNVCGVSVDPASNEIYVDDAEAKRIDIFSPAGLLVNKITGHLEEVTGNLEAVCSTAVNSTSHRVYNVNSGAEEGKSLRDKEAVFVYAPVAGKYEFQEQLLIDGSNTPAKTFMVEVAATKEEPAHLEAGGALHVAVAQASGDVYVAVAEQGLVDVFDAEGKYLRQIVLPTQANARNSAQSLAIDSSGDVYVVGEEDGNTVIYEFNPAGDLLASNTGVAAGGFGRISALAVDGEGHLYASDAEKRVVDEFDSSGAFMGRITGPGVPAVPFAEPVGVAVNAAGNVYVADRPVSAGTPGAVDVFGPAQKEVGPFLIGEASALNVTPTTATLQARIDPTGVDTKYHFQYTPEGGAPVSTEEKDAGSGEGIEVVSEELKGLSANTTYDFSVIVTAKGKAESGAHEPKTFTTQTEGAGLTLPDGRAWELVSPPDKRGGLIRGINPDGGVVQASADGSRISYSATLPFEAGLEANAGESPALSVRGVENWATRGIQPPDYGATRLGGLGTIGLENRIFSADLTHSLVDPFLGKPLLSPEASERAPYLRDLNDTTCQITETTCYTPLVTAKEGFANDTTSPLVPFGGTEVEQGGTFGPVRIQGATPELSHVVLHSGVALKAGAPSSGLYEWAAGKPPAEQLQLVSVLPDGTSVATQVQLGGAEQSGEIVRHAISDNGSRVFWSTPESAVEHLYMRDTTSGETIEIDAPAAGVTPEPEGKPVFQDANADGSMVFFTDTVKLTEKSTASRGKPDLYVCRIVEEGGKLLPCQLTDLTAGVLNAGESANVQGLLPGVSEDGSYVYFVANGVLTQAENAQKEKATPGTCVNRNATPGATCNLYVRHFDEATKEWEVPSLIAVLSSGDEPDWGAPQVGRIEKLTTRVSPNGQYLAFMSDRSLTGYDNADASPSAGGAADEEVFRYGVPASANPGLVCASCNSSGQRPHGVFEQAGPSSTLLIDRQKVWGNRWLAGSVPGWTGSEEVSSYHQSRYLSDSGRTFFDSADALVRKDTNLKEDVYEYESNGEGGCALPAGCQALISSGESQGESAFLDASESGDDVFFLTIGKLVPEDIDTSFDVYDAHVCSGASPCPPPPGSTEPCISSATCQGAPGQPAGPGGAPASASTSGSGNVSGVVVQTPPTHGTLPSKVVKPTRAQQLSKALKACRKLKRKKPRVACEKTARKKYGPKKSGKSAKRSSKGKK
jgi:DNA-binding beta-propeller fold protein YncE